VMRTLYAVKMTADGMVVYLMDGQMRRIFFTTREEAEQQAEEQRRIAASTVEITVQQFDIEDEGDGRMPE
jgi:hypothetical protein